MKRWILLAGLAIAADPAAAGDDTSCHFCGEHFCLPVQSDYRVGASRPAKDVVVYNVLGADFRLALTEGPTESVTRLTANGKEPKEGKLKAETPGGTPGPGIMTVSYEAPQGTPRSRLHIACSSAVASRCQAIVSQIVLDDPHRDCPKHNDGGEPAKDHVGSSALSKMPAPPKE